MTMTNDEIRTALDEMQVSTARGRAELIGQAIDLGPKPYEVDEAIRSRADGYIQVYRRLGEVARENSAGMEQDELEAVEWIRENMMMLVRSVCILIAERG